MRVAIELQGCDETSYFDIEVADTNTLNAIAEASAWVREQNYKCYPILTWKEVKS